MALDNAGLEAEIGITLNKLTKQLAVAEARMNKSARKMEGDFKRANTGVNKGFAAANRGANTFAKGGIRNVSLQLSQVAQQGAVTGNYLQALSIQLPDLALGFGTVGIAVGALGAILAPLAIDFVKNMIGAQDLDESMKELAASTTAYRQAVSAAAQPTKDLVEQYGNAAGKARELLDLQMALEKINAAAALRQVQSGISEQFGTLADLTEKDVQSYAVNLKRLEDLRQSADDLFEKSTVPATTVEGILGAQDNTEQLLALQAEIAEVQTALAELEPAFTRVKKELNLTDEAAEDLLTALIALRDADGPEKLGDDLKRVTDLYIKAIGLTEDMTEEQEALLRKMIEARLAALDIAAAADTTASSISSAAGEATRLADEMGRAAGNAASLAASGINSRAEAEIRLNHKGDPVGQATALAGQRFDSQVGDVTGFDPVLRDVLLEQRDAYVANAEAAEQARQGVIEWNKAQRSAAGGRGGGSGGRSGGRSSTDLFTSSDRQIERLQQQIDLLGQTRGRVAELTAKFNLLSEAKRRGLDLDKVQVETGKTLRQEIDAQAAAVGRLSAEFQQAQSQARYFDDQQQNLQDGLIDSIVEGENFIGVLADVARALARAALQAALFGQGPLAGLFGQTPGGGFLTSIVGGIFGARAGGGGVAAGMPYQVNENTPNSEVFVPGQNGAVLNVAQAQQAMRGAAASASSPNVSVMPADVKVIVIDDADRIGEYLNSPQGEQVLVTAMHRNNG